ncbi:HIT family protein [Peribacillus sp. NPDC006672]|uniref:HIT family protein n=1 Tax=Peribacillus sp. NPDC006672 TaxID=3390606 RepID=UPI003D08290A
MNENIECLGCRLANKKEPIYLVYEDDFVCCFLDHEPFNDGHVLILPKRHFKDVDELDIYTANAIMKTSILITRSLKKLFKPDGITICQNGGVFNELSHYHMHVVPRYKNQSFAEFYLEQPFDKKDEKNKLLETKIKLIEIIKTII